MVIFLIMNMIHFTASFATLGHKREGPSRQAGRVLRPFGKL